MNLVIGILALFILCCMYAVIEGEIKKKWQDRAKKKED